MDGIVLKKQYNSELDTSCSKQNHEEFAYLDHDGEELGDKQDESYHVYQLGQSYSSDELRVHHSDFNEDIGIGSNDYEKSSYEFDIHDTVYEECPKDDRDYNFIESDQSNSDLSREEEDLTQPDFLEFYDIKDSSDNTVFSLSDLSVFSNSNILLPKAVSARFAVVAGVMTVALGTLLFVGTSFAVKDRVDSSGKRAITAMKTALYEIGESNFTASGKNIEKAHEEFLFASSEMDKISRFATFISQFIPGASKLSSGNHVIEAGKYLTHSAKEMHSLIPVVIEQDSPLVSSDGTHVSFLALYNLLADKIEIVHDDVMKAGEHIDEVHLDDVPSEYQDTFVQMKELMPEIKQSLINAAEARPAVEELLGSKGQRTYLFLFQNNHEMRATGGFIGSYGILKINNGNIEKLIVDDIFNPDGQLIDKIVPPLPVQKISANWSLHDSNWFVDFPVSAKKAMDFYERTGGPTVDGVIAITPEMLEKLLYITGPIELQKYNTTITGDNAMEMLQSEVEDESNYIVEEAQKDLNSQDSVDNEGFKKQPKKILSDLIPILIERLTDRNNTKNVAALISAVSKGLKERHMIMYMNDKGLQGIIEKNKWSGSVLQTDKDYLSVINTNINGFKTDGVVDEFITHTAEIDDDGYIINTVGVRRVHNGGNTGYPWWDRVNSDYMRIYVPQGSELISVEGHTREINEERLSYDELGYERDFDVKKEEDGIIIDQETGTRIYDEYNKTVFANWVYVSPQETVTVTYKYRLPFRADFAMDNDGQFGSYAIVFQKQAGSERSQIKSNIILDDELVPIWHSHDSENMLIENDLITDRYHGVVFRVNNPSILIKY